MLILRNCRRASCRAYLLGKTPFSTKKNAKDYFSIFRQYLKERTFCTGDQLEEEGQIIYLLASDKSVFVK